MGGIALPTLLGLGAILIWGLFALLAAATEGAPPFFVTSLAFLIGGSTGFVLLWARGKLSLLRQPASAWALGVFGLFGYHAAYFAALKTAPPAEASLINYLWPLLIVLFSGLLPGERLQLRHIAGAMLGFSGVVVLTLSRDSFGAAQGEFPVLGFSLALACAFIWAIYSVLSRRMRAIPTEALVGFCLASGLLAGLAHLLFEARYWPNTGATWAALLALGLGPVGLAFFLWDIGMKQGDIRFLGVASYAAPVISTLALVLAGYASPHASLGLACLLIVGGALIAAGADRAAEPSKAD
jgi:drug/metabolite transporter (DMT)-like permease